MAIAHLSAIKLNRENVERPFSLVKGIRFMQKSIRRLLIYIQTIILDCPSEPSCWCLNACNDLENTDWTI